MHPSPSTTKLLNLPVEILLLVLEKVILDENVLRGCVSILKLSQTCWWLHDVINRRVDQLWKIPCQRGFGFTSLADVTYGGPGFEQHPRWRDLCRFSVLWRKPFPDAATSRFGATAPFCASSPLAIPVACSTIRGTTCKILSAAAAANEGRSPVTVEVGLSSVDDGLLTGAIRPGNYLVTPPCDESTCRQTSTHDVPGLKLEFDAERRVWHVACPHLDLSWIIGSDKPRKLAALCDTLVALLPGQTNESWQLCGYKAREASQTDSVWAVNVEQRWSQEMPKCTGPRVEMFKLTKRHVITAVADYHSSAMVLKSIYFWVIDSRDGSTLQVLRLPKSLVGGFHGSLSTVLQCEFIVTDCFIVFAGPGFGIFVWQFDPLSSVEYPLHQLPFPKNLSEELPIYVNLAMSDCGRFVVGVTKECVWVYDMLQKSMEGYHKGGKLGHRGLWMLDEISPDERHMVFVSLEHFYVKTPFAVESQRRVHFTPQ